MVSFRTPTGRIALALVLVVGVGAMVRVQNRNRFTAQMGGDGSCTPSVQEFTTPSGDSWPTGIVTGPDGNLWFVESRTNKIGMITPGGVITEYAIPTANSGPSDIAVGHDGNLWFVENPHIMGKGTPPKIGRITRTGTITEFAVNRGGDPGLYSITKGPNNSMWFTMTDGAGGSYPQAVGSITMAGVVTIYPRTPGVGVEDIVAGPDGNLWFTEGGIKNGNVVKMTPSGTMTEYVADSPSEIIAGPDGHLWFATFTTPPKVGRKDPNGTIQYFALNDMQYGAINGITPGTDGNTWISYNDRNYRSAVARITPSGGITKYAPFPWSQHGAEGDMTWGPDGKLWLAGGMNKITKMELCPTSSGSSSQSSGGSSIDFSSTSSLGSSTGGSSTSGDRSSRRSIPGGSSSYSNSSSCPAICGDYIIMAPEECDDAGANSDTRPDACRTNCRKAHCGDNVVDSGETCDDGNTEDGDGCPSTCAIHSSSSSSEGSSSSVGDTECDACRTCGSGFLNVCDEAECIGLGPCLFERSWLWPQGTCREDPQECQFYNACSSDQCIQVKGIGQDQCWTDDECIPTSSSSSSAPSHLECRDFTCEVVSGGGFDLCKENPECIVTHKDCRNDACVDLPGPGSQWCPSDCDVVHTECRNLACEVVPGIGEDQCGTEDDCIPTSSSSSSPPPPPPPPPPTSSSSSSPPTHLICDETRTCRSVAGPGGDQCHSDTDCAGDTHLECFMGTCRSTDGPGRDLCTGQGCGITHAVCLDQRCAEEAGEGQPQCTDDSNCRNGSHLTCFRNRCITVAGPGENTCQRDENCGGPSPIHGECRGNLCVQIPGVGTDSCTLDVNCGNNPQHLLCRQSRCLIESGPGPNTCARDSDCAVGSSSRSFQVFSSTAPSSSLNFAEGRSSIGSVGCGNSILERPLEECDDGNTNSFDGCSAECLSEIGVCGDGVVQKLLNEQCEPSLHDPNLPYPCTNCRLIFSFSSVEDGELVESAEREEPVPPLPTIPTVPSFVPPYAFLPPAQFSTPEWPLTLPSPAGRGRPMLQTRLPEQPKTGPEILAVMAAGAAGGLAYMRRRRRP